MIVVLVGPTAVGKSALAIAVATALSRSGQPTEIVNADSMLVYRGMDIGTAKPTAAERALVRHHLLDILEITEVATVAEFQGLARAAIADCCSRGVVPLVVGGSALYIRAIVDDFQFPGTDAEVRATLTQDLQEHGPMALHRRLHSLDPIAARAIEPANGRRIVRALEVIELTGRPFSAALPERRYSLPGVRQLGLAMDRPTLDDRIASRVDGMWAAGLVEEVSSLAERGLRSGLTASRALGYRQVLQFLDGELTESQAHEATIAKTLKLARRQNSWFAKDERIHWLDWDRPDLVATALSLCRRNGAAAQGAPRRPVTD